MDHALDAARREGLRLRPEVPQGRGRLIRKRPSLAAACRAVAIAAALISSAAIPACKERTSQPADAAQGAVRKDRYTVRGVVAMLPVADNPSSEFQVRHEAMPHFVGEGGALGMDTMTMPFPLAEGMSIASLNVGDKIELTFEVDFDEAAGKLVSYRAVSATPLPAETELDFSPLKK